ncbi:MAG: DUF4301 family protein [Chlorobi bacterium]|nr:DUF4301 family protein [Chlorobiota bacterium]
MKWLPKDLDQFNRKGIPPLKIEEQLARFESGFQHTNVIRPAIPGDGIIRLSSQDQEKYKQRFEEQGKSVNMMRFIPASGAATRMFKELFNAREQLSGNHPYELSEEAQRFFDRLENFPFYRYLAEVMEKNGTPLKKERNKKACLSILEFVLDEKGLNYGQKPKGQILFHHYPDGNRTAFEEHLVESTGYARQENELVFNHFTVSPQHRSGFEQILSAVKEKLEKQYGVLYHTSFSVQKSSTDTIAVDPDHKPFRLDDGSILFRPGGHGALIENLNDLDTNLVFIKNIDNVAPDYLKKDTVNWKKILGGILLSLLGRIYGFQQMLEQNPLSDIDLKQMIDFARKELCVYINQEVKGVEELREMFFRPVRVCGMVRNEGESGGGPFWVRDNDGKVSLQIVESAQIDMNDPEKYEIVSGSTHFNPVDIVCSVRDFAGRKYDLRDFVNHDSGFISQKSFGGRDLKALELPGLWNGAMAGWITLFVEVPPSTFTPVKTVNDLLRKEHQPEV